MKWRHAFVPALAAALLGAPAAHGAALDTLAHRYAPVVRLSEQERPCGGGEPYQPLDVNTLFGNDEVALRGPWEGANLVGVGPTAAQLATGKYGYALDFPGNPLSSSACSYEQWERRTSTGYPPKVFAHVAAQGGKLALQYWFFYVYNDFNNKHEGDWEMIQLDFDAPTVQAALRTHPYEAGYTQHDGAERADWGSAKLELVGGTHPVVYPAEGSHANYFSSALFLGRSAAQGVGCDDTDPPWRELRPAVGVVPEGARAQAAAYPWLDYRGRWGERRSGFYDAPTGPSGKLQWSAPFTWAEHAWRPKSFALAGGRSLGPTATSFFCGAVSQGSTGLIYLEARPSATVFVLLLIAAGLIWLATRTRWDESDPHGLRRHRPWGSLVTSAGRAYAGNALLFLRIGGLFVGFGLAIAGLQYLVFRVTGVSSLVEGLGESDGVVDAIVLGFGLVLNLIGLTLVQAVCTVALVDIDEGRDASATRAARDAFRRFGALFGGLAIAVLVVVALDFTLVGLPIAIWLVVRWSLLAQAVAAEGTSAIGGLRRSAQVVRGHWFRAASLVALVTGVALLLGPVVGALLLFTTSASFDLVNLASDLVYAISLPFAAIATTYLYFDLETAPTEAPSP